MRPPPSWVPWSASVRSSRGRAAGWTRPGCATFGPSAMTLGGLLKHLALIEDEYFSHRLPGREPGPPWDAVDGDADPDGEWHSAAEDSPAQLMTLWQDAVARSRAAVAGGTGQRRAGPAGARLAGYRAGQPAADPDRPDRGVLAARGPRRPHPGVGGRARRGGPAGLTRGAPLPR